MPSSRQKDNRFVTLFMAITQNPRQMVNQLRLTGKMAVRRFERLPLVARCALGWSMFFSFAIYGSLFYLIFGNQLKSESFLEMSKCPACYGFRACDIIKSDEAYLTGFSKVRFLDYVNVANVHHGIARGKSVIIQKLGSNRDIAALDAAICSFAREPEGCEVGAAAARSFPASGTKWMISHLTGKSSMTACPTERLIERVMDKYYEKLDAIMLSARERSQLVTTLMINPEPVLYQTFPAAEGWPFPVYVGACGRFVVTENGDARPLREFRNADFKLRAQLALGVLNIAKVFADNPSRFALYWTRLDDMGLAVNSSGHVIVTDGRAIVIVDKFDLEQRKPDGWDATRYSEFAPCEPGFDRPCPSVKKEDICERHTVDHNYYMTCHGLLSRHAHTPWGGETGGFLHSVPKDVDELYDVGGLLEKCAKPTKPGQRLTAVAQLMKALAEISGTSAPGKGL